MATVPAGTDWPEGVGEATWWPIVVAGAADSSLAVGLTVLSRRTGFVAGLGPVSFVAGVVAQLLQDGWVPGRAGDGRPGH